MTCIETIKKPYKGYTVKIGYSLIVGLQTVGFVVFHNSNMNLEFISSNNCLLTFLKYMSVSYKNYFSALVCFLLLQLCF